MKVSSYVAVGMLASSVGIAARADACGGCFQLQSTADSIVTGHRMAFAISESRTVLWDQIKFTGAPEDFGWVLPVKPGAKIEESNDAWFEALEGVTAVRVTSPQIQCPPSGSPRSSGCNIGCGASETSDGLAASAGGPGFEGPPVTVVHEGTVGPYKTATLSSRDAGALRTWLSDHGYAVPPDVEPIIDAYVSEGADFIALQLAPGKGVNQMTPVRVVTPGGDPILPLRMVAAGTGSLTDIVLYVIGEGRYGLKDLAEQEVKLGDLSFDFSANESNYSKLRDEALGENNGISYITAFASREAFFRNFDAPSQFFQNQPLVFSDTQNNSYADFASLYFGQANLNDNLPASSFFQCGQSVLQRLRSDLLVAGKNPADAGAPAARDAGLSDGGSHDAGSHASQVPTPTGLIPADLTCGGHDDIAAALIGMHPSETWVARLEMNLPREAFTMDCNVELAGSQTEVSNQLSASKMTNPPCANPTIVQGSMTLGLTGSTSACVWTLGSLVSLLVRRHRRRQSG